LVLVGPWNGPSAVRPARWAEVLAVVAMAVSALATYAVSVSSAPLVGEAKTLDIFHEDQPTSRTEGGIPDPFLTAARWQLEPGYENLTLFAIAGPQGLEQRPTWASFSTYNGIAWIEPPTYGVPGNEIPPEVVGAPRRTFDTGARVTVAVGLPGQWVPSPQRVNNVTSRIETRVDPASGIVAAVTSPIDNTFDLGYSLTVADRAELEATFPAQSGPDDPALALPAPLSGRLLDLANRVSATSPDTWTRLVTLAQELRGDVFTAAPPSALGAGAPDRTYAGLDRVLAEGVGFQEQYAAIWALIARSWDVPTRMVIGFPLQAEGSPLRTVNADQVSIWAEARLDGLGWVAFQPSPQDRDQKRRAVVRPLTPDEVPTVPDGDSGGTSGGGQGPDGNAADGADAADGDGAVDGLSVSWPLVAVVFLVLVIIVWLLAVATRRRRIRAALASGTPRDRAHGAWIWARLMLAEAWMPLPTVYAPAADVERPLDLPDDLAGRVHGLAQAVAPLIYGPAPDEANADAAWAAADALTAAVRTATGWRTTLRRYLIPLQRPVESVIVLSDRGTGI
ncbi:MAG: transglutaminase-like domain-containing protein, partial [Candidatus Nanopelagicales bacterium]